MIDLDDAGGLAAGDPGDMLGAVTALARHCREGYDVGRGAADLPSIDGVTSVVFCGMGGSAVAGDVLRALTRERLGIPIDVHRSPVLPEYCGPHTLVLCSSYSGNTAETLSCFREAVRRGARTIAITSGGTLASEAASAGSAIVRVPGGFPPRAALGFLTFATIGVLERAGLLPPMAGDVDETTAELDSAALRLSPDVRRADNPAKELAWQLGDRVPVIWGADGIGAVAAARWKTQFNENAKIPAWASSLPELDHNEVVGWTRPAGEMFAVIALRHEGEHPDVAARFPLSLDMASEAGAVTAVFWAAGRSPLARLFSLILIGDLTSTYAALLHGIDPSPVLAIDRLKAALAEAGAGA